MLVLLAVLLCGCGQASVAGNASAPASTSAAVGAVVNTTTKAPRAGDAACSVVSGAVSKYNNTLDGMRAETLTVGDMTSALKSVGGKLDEAVSFGGPAGFTALVGHASTTIKQMRVALDSGETDVGVYVSSSTDDLTRAAVFCK